DQNDSDDDSFGDACAPIVTNLLVDDNGALDVSWFDPLSGKPWHAPLSISAAGVAPPGAAVAMARQTSTVLTALLFDAKGALNVSWFDTFDGKPWHAPVPFSANGLAPPGASVAMAKQNDNV